MDKTRLARLEQLSRLAGAIVMEPFSTPSRGLASDSIAFARTSQLSGQPLTTARIGKVLEGMIARGHGVEAIAFFLQITRDAVFDLVVQHGLRTPHDRPRRAGGAKAWAGADYSVLMTGWLACWRAASIAECVGRSAGSVWSQARRLGLPRRDRKSLIKPARVERALDARSSPPLVEQLVPEREERPSVCTAPSVPPPPCQDAPAVVANPVAAPSTPREWLVRNATKPVWRRYKANRNEVDWTRELDEEIENRFWAYQHPEAARKDLGVSFKALVARYQRLELPRRDRSRLVEHYDPSAIQTNIREKDYVKAPCHFLKDLWWIWRERSERRKVSRRAKKTSEYKAAKNLCADAASVVLPVGSFFAL